MSRFSPYPTSFTASSGARADGDRQDPSRCWHVTHTDRPHTCMGLFLRKSSTKYGRTGPRGMAEMHAKCSPILAGQQMPRPFEAENFWRWLLSPGAVRSSQHLKLITAQTKANTSSHPRTCALAQSLTWSNRGPALEASWFSKCSGPWSNSSAAMSEFHLLGKIWNTARYHCYPACN